MYRVGSFEKVSFGQYAADFSKTLKGDYSEKIGLGKYPAENQLREIWEDIKLPKRATAGSAGNDFFAPHQIILAPGESIILPTGIRVYIDKGWVLQIYPRSGLGFKYRMQLDNVVGIIDEDYFYSENEGHIMAKITNDGHEGKTIVIEPGQGYLQGIFMEYGITFNDDVTDIRNGGFGSTTRRRSK